MTPTQPTTTRQATTTVAQTAVALVLQRYGPRATAVRLTTGDRGGGYFQAYAPVGDTGEVTPVGPSFLVGAPTTGTSRG